MKHLKVLSAAAIAVTITLPVAANAGKPVNLSLIHISEPTRPY